VSRHDDAVGRPPAAAELALALAALFVLARAPALFLRQRTANAFGGPIVGLWTDDPLIRGAFLTVEMMVLIVALRVCGWRPLVRLRPLMPFLAFVLLSAFWSVEAGVTVSHGLMLMGTALVGWYIGERFAVHQQAVVVAGAAAVGAVGSVVALVVWPEISQATDGHAGLWSGVYVHRNLLGLAMSTGLLALPFALWHERGSSLATGLAIGFLEAYLLWRSGSRTGIVALLAAGSGVGVVAFLRLSRRLGVTASRGAAMTLAVAGVAGYGVRRNWDAVLSLLGRSPTLTSRADIWDIMDRFVARRPLIGWGFEAFWSHPPAVAEATAAFYFAHVHSGYYEVVLGVGWLGFALFMLFMAVTVWSVFRHAWQGFGPGAFWPLAVVVFVAVTDFSESFLVANDAQWSLLVMAGTTASKLSTESGRRTAPVAA
jgi:O-antigen ligase